MQGCDWYHLHTILDDHSIYILIWKRSKTMVASEIRDTLEVALAKAKLVWIKAHHHQ
jgi:transposase InsO family protein